MRRFSVKKVLSLLLALMMFLSAVPVTTRADDASATSYVESWSLTLRDDIAVNFNLQIDEQDKASTVQAQVGDKTLTWEAASAASISVPVSAAQMTDEIVISLVNGETVTRLNSYTVRQYADYILANSDCDYTKSLVRAMLEYGTAAQRAFSYQTGNLANSGLEAIEMEIPSAEIPKVEVSGAISGIKYCGASVLAQNKIAIRFYFQASDLTDVEFTVDGASLTPVATDTGCYVDVRGITPDAYSNPYTVVVTKGEASFSVTYSVMHYINRMYNKEDSSEGTKTLVRGLLSYHTQALEYVAMCNGQRDIDNGISWDLVEISTLLDNDFSENKDKGVDANWKRTAHFQTKTAELDNGWVRITSENGLFVYGNHAWGCFGGVGFTKGNYYTAEFDIKPGATDTNQAFNLYITKQNDNDPYGGTAYKTLTLNFGDFENFIAVNTDDFASVSYRAETGTAHVKVLFQADSAVNTQMIARSANSNWLLDNLLIQQVVMDKDFDNEVSFSVVPVAIKLSNDFAEDINKGVDATWKRTAFFQTKTAALDNGWARITSENGLFIYGGHDWGAFGGIMYTKGAYYTAEFDLMLGDVDANKAFNLYTPPVNGSDPYGGTAYKTLTLNFADFENFVTTNTDNFAHVTYDAQTNIAQIKVLFQADETAANTQMIAKCAGANNWLLDNLLIQQVIIRQDYDNQVTHNVVDIATKFENDFQDNKDKGVDASWKRTAFFQSVAELEDGQVRITSEENLFAYGTHDWGQFGGVGFTKGERYTVAFDLKPGDADANKIFNLYVTTMSASSPYAGTAYKTLTLNFADFTNFVTANTDDFAHVTYNAATDTAHINVYFRADATANTILIAKCAGTNNWLLDNLVVKNVAINCTEHVDADSDSVCDSCGTEIIVQNYDNGVEIAVMDVSTKFANDFSENANKGVTQTWHKSSFFGSTAALEDGWARITSEEHIFVYGSHSWGSYGGVGFTKGTYYTVDFDLKLGSEQSNKVFNLYVMTENGDSRDGTVVKTLTLNFANIENFVTTNTDGCARVTYDGKTGIAHVKLLFQANADINTQIVAKSVGSNNWLLDNLCFKEVQPVCDAHTDTDNDDVCDVCGFINAEAGYNPLFGQRVKLLSFDYGDVKLYDGLYKQSFDGCMSYYDTLTADDILYRWRKVSGMDTKTGRDLGWATDTSAECCIAQLISAKARRYAVTGAQSDLQLVKDVLQGYQEIITETGGYPLMYSAYFFEKTLRCFIDAYEYCGLEEGYRMAKALVYYGMTNDPFQNPTKYLGDNGSEWYTMGEALYMLAELAEEKGESAKTVEKYYAFAALYDYTEFWDIFRNGENVFDYSVAVDRPYNEYFHAYSHANSFNSALEAYEQTGNTDYLNASVRFYQWLEDTQKLATGGYGTQWEWLLPKDALISYLRTTPRSTETQCNSYAVVNMDNRLMSYTANGAYGQWTEDAFYNMTIASLETQDGCPHYYSDYSADGGTKSLRTDWPWACCAGTRPLVMMEYLKSIYFHDGRNMYVNLYTNSSVEMTASSGNVIVLTQQSDFPVTDTVEFTVMVSQAEAFALCFREPAWLASDAVIQVNGETVSYIRKEGWLTLERMWNNGDQIVLKLPMELYYEEITENGSGVYALKYGPVVLACDGVNTQLATMLPLSKNPNSLLQKQGNSLIFTSGDTQFKPYYDYPAGAKYTLYISIN